jgi:hypothetical protein
MMMPVSNVPTTTVIVVSAISDIWSVNPIVNLVFVDPARMLLIVAVTSPTAPMSRGLAANTRVGELVVEQLNGYEPSGGPCSVAVNGQDTVNCSG